MATASYPARRSPPPPTSRLRAGVATPHEGARRTSPRSPPPLPPLRPVLTPELLAALRNIAPKPRRRRLPYVIAVAFAVVVGALSRDPAARALVAAAVAKTAFVGVASGSNVH